MGVWEYQKTLHGTHTIDKAHHEIKLEVPKNETLNGIQISQLGSNGISAIIINDGNNNKSYSVEDAYRGISNLNLTNKFTLVLCYDDKYLSTCHKIYLAAVYYYPPCDCCVEDDEIILYDENEEITDEEIDGGKIEFRYKFTRYAVAMPNIILNFQGENETKMPRYDPTDLS
jgi:hypothetical protein